MITFELYQTATVSDEDRKRGLYIIGKPRTGKSTLLESLILGDIEAGRGVCVIDPHSDLIAGVLSRIPSHRRDDVILLDLLDPEVAFGMNPFACENTTNPVAIERTLNRVMQIFERLWGYGSQNNSWGPRLEQYLRSVTVVLLQHGLTMAEAPLLLSLRDDRVRKYLVRTLPNEQLRYFWEEFETLIKREKEQRIESTANKLSAFLDTPLGRSIVGQEEDDVDWRKAMDQGRIVLVKLDAQLGELSALIGSVIVGRILEAGLSRQNDPQRRPFYLYADEFQRFATDDFARLLTETAKFGVFCTVAHQYRAQLDKQNQGATLQAGGMVVFQVSGEDAKELAGHFNATPPLPTVPRERPIRIYQKLPLRQLTHVGHANPRVRELVERWFCVRPQGINYGRDSTSGISSWGSATDRIDIALGFLQKGLPADEVLEKARYWASQVWDADHTAALFAAVMELGGLLRSQPVMIDSGQYETVDEPTRTYSDVTDQIANELATLPLYTAKARFNERETSIAVETPTRPLTGLSFPPVGVSRALVATQIHYRHQALRDAAGPPSKGDESVAFSTKAPIEPLVDEDASYREELPPARTRKVRLPN